MNRLTKTLCVVLLTAVPLAYLAWCSWQSTKGSEKRKQVAAAVTPVTGRPELATRNIYNVPVPAKATTRRYFETNSWNTSTLYARFTTVPRGLDWFLGRLGTKRSELVPGSVPITLSQQKTFGWHFEGPWAARQKLAGIHLEPEEKGKPSINLLVNLTHKDHPRVYIVSTVKF